MKPFEFVLIIVSVVVGLALTEFAMGIADMIRASKTAVFYWPHIALIGWGFLGFLNYWGTVYKLRRVSTWTVPNIGIVILTGLLFFIATRMVFPSGDNFDHNYERYFNENVVTILFTLIAFMVFFTLEGLLVRKSRAFKNYVMSIIFFALMLSGVIINNNSYRGILMYLLLVLQFYYMYASKTQIYEDDAKSN